MPHCTSSHFTCPIVSKKREINQFAKHVAILDEQYIDKEIDVPVMIQRKVPTAQTIHQEQWSCIRCSPSKTVDNISVNRQRQVSHTGTAPGQDLGDVSCEDTHVPMIQKVQKTVEILQVPHIDKVIEVPQAQFSGEAVEVPENMQRNDPMVKDIEDAQKTCKQSRSHLGSSHGMPSGPFACCSHPPCSDGRSLCGGATWALVEPCLLSVFRSA